MMKIMIFMIMIIITFFCDIIVNNADETENHDKNKIIMIIMIIRIMIILIVMIMVILIVLLILIIIVIYNYFSGKLREPLH